MGGLQESPKVAVEVLTTLIDSEVVESIKTEDQIQSIFSPSEVKSNQPLITFSDPFDTNIGSLQFPSIDERYEHVNEFIPVFLSVDIQRHTAFPIAEISNIGSIEDKKLAEMLVGVDQDPPTGLHE